MSARVEANSVPPRRFKAVMGRYCADYGTSQQQDASYFFMHFLSLLEQEERAAKGRVGGNDVEPPCSRLFAFSLEQRVQCGTSGAVSSFALPCLCMHLCKWHIARSCSTCDTRVHHCSART